MSRTTNVFFHTFTRPRCISLPDESRDVPYTQCDGRLAWGCKAGSPVWNNFLAIEKHLLDYCLHPEFEGGYDISVTLCLLGTAPDMLQPVIVLSCVERSYCRRAVDLIRNSPEWKDFVKKHKEFGITYNCRAPRALGQPGERLAVSSVGYGIFTVGSPLSIGNATEHTNASYLKRSATLGPCLSIEGHKVFTTVFHVLSDVYNGEPVDCKNDDDEQSQIYFDGYDDENTIDASQHVDQNDRQKTVAKAKYLQSAVAFQQQIPCPSNTGTDRQAILDNSHRAYTEQTVQSPTASTKELSMNPSPFPTNNQLPKFKGDAIEKLESAPLLTNPKIQGAMTVTSHKHDWSLVEESAGDTSSIVAKSKFNLLFMPSYFDKPIVVGAFGNIPTFEISVFVVTGRNEVVQGLLLPMLSQYKLWHSKAFTRVLNLRTEEYLKSGHCGSAVVDANDGTWYGHIIAAYPDYKTALVVPACDIRESIAMHMNVDTSLVQLNRPSCQTITSATFALQSTVALYNMVSSFQFRPKHVRDLVTELEALNGVLGPLNETLQAAADADLTIFDLPLSRCGNVCKNFELELLKHSSHLGGGPTNFRDWAKLRCTGYDIDDFRELLAGYVLTFSIALIDTNLRETSIKFADLESYRNLIDTASGDLQVHLESINDKFDIASSPTVTDSYSDRTKLIFSKQERSNTIANPARARREQEGIQQCLKICSTAYDHLITRASITGTHIPDSASQSAVSISGDILFAKDRELAQRTRQIGGFLNDASFVQFFYRPFE